MYARIHDSGRLEIFHKRCVVIDDVLTVNPSAQVMARAGYKPLVMTDEPMVGEGQTLTLDYRDAGDRIEGVYSVIGGVK